MTAPCELLRTSPSGHIFSVGITDVVQTLEEQAMSFQKWHYSRYLSILITHLPKNIKAIVWHSSGYQYHFHHHNSTNETKFLQAKRP
jgi:hypothetical protein